MEPIEIASKDLNEALAKAADSLNVPVERVAHEVIEESAGLFGKSTIRIRAWVAPEPEPEPEVQSEPEGGEPVESPEPAKSKGRARKSKAVPAEQPVTEADADESEDEPAPVVATPEDAEEVLEVVNQIIRAGNLNMRARVESLNNRYVNLKLEGKDVAFIVGKRGEGLNAMQYLVNIILGRKLANGVRATIDGDDYRQEREAKLTKLAQTLAREVRKRGEEAVLEALPAFERRIVHKAVMEIEGVETYSEGEEPNRRVVIAPKD